MNKEKQIFYKKLFSLVLPIAMQNLMTALVSASDALMLGLLDQNSLSAISLATQVQFVLNLFQFSLIMGATVLAAQYWGKGDKNAVEEILAIVLKVSVIISAIFFAAAWFTPALLMKIFTNETELILLGSTYLKVVSWSYLLTGVSQIYLCIMKNSGRTLYSTIYSSTAVVLNIILNAILIFGLAGMPRMEIEGAALATVIARLVEFLFVIAEHRKKEVVRIRLCYLKSSNAVMWKDFIKYTKMIFANEMAWGCGFTMFSVIMGHLGNDAVAANSIANIVKNIIACFCLGLASGSGILVGNELGKGKLDRAKEYGDRLVKLSVVAGVISGLILLAVSPLILQFSTLSEQARAYLKVMLCICSYYLVGKSFNSTVISGIFCAGGDTKFGFLCDLVNMWVVIVPMGLFAAFVLDLPVLAVYFILNLDEIIKIPVEIHHYRKYKWLNNLTRTAE